MCASGGGGGGGVNTSNAAFNIRDKKNYIFINILELKHIAFLMTIFLKNNDKT